MLCCGYTLTDFPISIRLTSLALWQSNDCPSASKATLMNMDKYFMWIHYERLHNHNKAKHNKTVCIVLGIYCSLPMTSMECCNVMLWCLRFMGIGRWSKIRGWCSDLFILLNVVTTGRLGENRHNYFGIAFRYGYVLKICHRFLHSIPRNTWEAFRLFR